MQMLPCDRTVCAAAVLLTSVGAARAACPPAWLPLGYMSCEVRTLLRLPTGEIIAGGTFNRAGAARVNGVARWDGALWSPLGNGVGFPNSGDCSGESVYCLAQFQSRVVAGGNFQDLRGIAAFDGASWTTIGGGFNTLGGDAVRALAVRGADLVVAGRFTQAGEVPALNIATWDGSAWSALGSGIQGSVYALALTPSGDLIVGGDFVLAGGQPALHIARWNGVAWSAIGSGFDAPVRALAVLPTGEILAGGEFQHAGATQTSLIARWSGSAWAPVGSILSFPGDAASAIVVDSGGAILLGTSYRSNLALPGRPVGVGRWDGLSWGAPAGGIQGDVFAFLDEPDGAFAAAGAFRGTASYPANLARFRPEIPGEDPPAITASPAGSSTCSGLPVTLSAGASAAAPLTYQWEVEMAGVWLPLTLGRQTPSGGYLACSNPQSAQTSVRMFGARAAETLRFRAVASAACLSASTEVAEISFSPLLGDIDSSGAVDMADLVVMLSSYGNATTTYGPGDLNGDGRIDFADLSRFLAEYGRSCGS